MESPVVQEKELINPPINLHTNILSVEVDVDDIDNVEQFKIKPAYNFFKRIFDIFCSLIALIILSPLLITVMIIIYLDDKGSPIYSQERVGKNQKIFKIYKLRSMYINADKDEIELRKKNGCANTRMYLNYDPRITKIGNFIRKTSIDELPQLINILKGDMSIIGPRPLIIYEHSQLENNDDFIYRYNVLPGLSCYEQVSNRKNIDSNGWIELDKKYVNERSFIVDLKIIFKTFIIVFKRNNH